MQAAFDDVKNGDVPRIKIISGLLLIKEKNDFTQFCCLKQYSVVCSRKLEFLFHAIIILLLYNGNV